jgi:hypothetical protein
LIRDRVGAEKADQASNELPDRLVLNTTHSDLLSKYGIDPQELLSGGLGGIGDKLGL